MSFVSRSLQFDKGKVMIQISHIDLECLYNFQSSSIKEERRNIHKQLWGAVTKETN